MDGLVDMRVDGFESRMKTGEVELRAVLIVDGHETDIHMSNLRELSWHMGPAGDKATETLLPVARRIFEAIYQTGHYSLK